MATIEELDGDVWTSPGYDSHLGKRVFELRKTGLSAFNMDDCRLMVGQGMSLEHVVPQALALLAVEPSSDDEVYPYALWEKLCEVDAAFWEARDALYQELRGLAQKTIGDLEESWERRIEEAREAYGATLTQEAAADADEWRIYQRLLELVE